MKDPGLFPLPSAELLDGLAGLPEASISAAREAAEDKTSAYIRMMLPRRSRLFLICRKFCHVCPEMDRVLLF